MTINDILKQSAVTQAELIKQTLKKPLNVFYGRIQGHTLRIETRTLFNMYDLINIFQELDSGIIVNMGGATIDRQILFSLVEGSLT